MTLIVGIRSKDGLILAADSEESTYDLRTYADKIHFIQTPLGKWKTVIAGAGWVDYIGMACDLIRENIERGEGRDTEIIEGIRKSLRTIWRDHARFEPQKVDLNLLIGSWSSDCCLRFTLVSGAAVRNGRDLEAMGSGASTFVSLADRFLHRALPSAVSGNPDAIRLFTAFAMQHAKRIIPGVGGNSRIITLTATGEIKQEKGFKIGALQTFFSQFDYNFKHLLGGLWGNKSAEDFVRALSKMTIRDIRKLQKELERIENDQSLG